MARSGGREMQMDEAVQAVNDARRYRIAPHPFTAISPDQIPAAGCGSWRRGT